MRNRNDKIATDEFVVNGRKVLKNKEKGKARLITRSELVLRAGRKGKHRIVEGSPNESRAGRKLTTPNVLDFKREQKSSDFAFSFTSSLSFRISPFYSFASKIQSLLNQ